MTYSIGGLIEASDFNDFRTTVLNIWQIGTGDRGYNQAGGIPAATSIGSLILSSEWTTLRDTVAIASQHQTGAVDGDIPAGTTLEVGDLIAVSAFNTAITTIDTNRLTFDSGSVTIFASQLVSTRATSWSTSVTHEYTVDYSTENAARAFFNSGGDIRVAGSRTGGSATPQNTDWTNLLSGMGTIIMNYTQTTESGSGGTPTAIGYYDLTGSYQTIYSKAGTGAYAANIYSIQARRENFVGALGGNGSLLRFLVTFNDAHTSGFSDNVDGTLTSTISMQKATTYLTIPSPSFITTSAL